MGCGLTTNQKKSSSWSVIFSYPTQQQRTISRLDCDVQRKVDFCTTTGDVQLSGWTKKKLQSISWSQTCTKKRSWSLSGGLLPVWSSRAFWIPVKPLHLRSVLSKLLKCAENCSSCIRRWSRDWAHSSPWQCTTSISELEWTGDQVLPHSPYSPALSDRLSRLQASRPLFAGKMFAQPAGGRTWLPRERLILKQGFFARRINRHFLYAKCVDCNSSYFD